MLSRIAEGNEGAFTELFKRYGPILMVNISKIVPDRFGAEEILQETFIKIWLNREHLSSIENLTGYFLRMASNECFSYLNRLVRRKQIQQQAGIGNELILNPEDFVSYKETEAIIINAINELPAQRKLIYKLSRNQGLNSTQIARQLQINSDYVRQALSAARKHIKEKLSAAGKLILLLCSGFF